MSERLHFDRLLRPISQGAAARAAAAAEVSPRHRAIVRYHEHAEGVQRMLNAVEPGSYVRPHRHLDPPKVEVFVVLSGAARLVAFDDEGELLEVVSMAAGGPTWGCEIPPGTWHSLVSDSRDTVLYEVIEGAYVAGSHKDYAAWAPEEATREGEAFLEQLRGRLEAWK